MDASRSGGQRLTVGCFFLAAAVGLALIDLSRLPTAWMVLVAGLICVLAALPVLAYARVNLPFFFLCVYTVLLPLDISKAFTFYLGSEECIKYVFVQDIISFFMITSWLIERAVSRESSTRIRVGSVVLPYVLFVVWAELSVLNAVKPHLTLLHTTTFIKWFLIFLCVSNVLNTKKRFQIVLACLVGTIFFESGYALLQTQFRSMMALEGQKATMLGRGLNYGTGFQQLLRPSGTFQHPNVLGSYMVYVLPPVFALLLGQKKRILQVFFYVTLGTGFLALLLSYSRGGWLGFAGAALVVVGVAMWKKMIRPKTVATLLCTAAVLAALAFPLAQSLVARLFRPDDSSTATRIVMLRQAASMVQAHPVLGIGFANYAETSKDYLPDNSNLIRFAPKGYIAHNKYAVIGAETGLVGLALYLWVLFSVLRMGLRNLRAKDPFMLYLSIGLVAGMIGGCLGMLFDHYSDNSRNILFWYFTGWIAAVTFYLDRNEPETKAGSAETRA